MAGSNDFILTRAGYEDLQRELEMLQDRLSGKVDELEQMGNQDDHVDGEWEREPAFYEMTTDRQWLTERISHLRLVLEQAEVIDEDPDENRVNVGDRVTVWNFNTETEEQFDILGGEEVAHGRDGVAHDSPVGSALLNKSVGDVVEVNVPDGQAKYAVRAIGAIS